jgi:hypothetical protein
MTLNKQTGKYETPVPRWFNKDTGDYEDVRPMYFVDPTNPSLGMVMPSRVSQEDASFRQFLLDKEERRRTRILREAAEAERVRLALLNAEPKQKEEKYNASAERFDDELAQKSFREITGVMFSKRGATAFSGPAQEKEEQQREELARRYSPLKPFSPGDAEIEKLPPPIDENAILEAWKNSKAIRAIPQAKKRSISEAERAKALVRNKSGLRTGYTFSAKEGSYIPPNSTTTKSSGGWDGGVVVGPSEKVAEEEGAVKRGEIWRKNGPLQNQAWWKGTGREDGRLALNPVTGKLEDRGTSTGITSKVKLPQASKEGILPSPCLLFVY